MKDTVVIDAEFINEDAPLTGLECALFRARWARENVPADQSHPTEQIGEGWGGTWILPVVSLIVLLMAIFGVAAVVLGPTITNVLAH